MSTKRKWTADEVKNILFTAVALLAALAVYFLAYSDSGGKGGDFQTPLPSPTPGAAATPSPAPPGRDEAAFLEALAASGLRVIDDGAAGVLYLRDPDRPGRVRLDYSLRNGYVTAWTLTFSLPVPTVTPTYKSKWETPVPEPVQRRWDKETAAINESLLKLIRACAAALDEKGALPAAVTLRWYDGAVDARNRDKDYEDTFAGFTFMAGPTLEGAAYALRVSLIAS